VVVGQWEDGWKLLQTSIAMVLEQLAMKECFPWAPSSLYFITLAISKPLMYSLDFRSTPLDPFYVSSLILRLSFSHWLVLRACFDRLG